MTSYEIDAFLAICSMKSVSKAAEALFISQSSLSIRLKNLEEHLGCKLFVRGKGTREMTLTVQGQSFYTMAVQYNNLLKSMENIGHSIVTEELRVSAINSVGNYLMPKIFTAFTDTYPHIQLSIQDMEAEMASMSIICGKTDLAFSTADIQTDDIITTPFLQDPYALICSADSSYGDNVGFEELDRKNEVHIKWSVAYNYWYKEKFGTDVAPNINLELMGQISLFVAQPNKWAIVPFSVANTLSQSGKIRKCNPMFEIPNRQINVLRSRERVESPNVGLFLETARAELKKEEYGIILL